MCDSATKRLFAKYGHACDFYIVVIKLLSNTAACVCVVWWMATSSTISLADEVIDWDNVTLQAIRTAAASPPVASRLLAMESTAVYDAVNSVNPIYAPYHTLVPTAQGTSAGAAAAEAAYDVLVSVYPTQQTTFSAALANSLSAMADGAGKTAGIALGDTVAASIIALRSNDGSSNPMTYVPGSGPGVWQPTPPAFAPALLPQWGSVTPWAMNSDSQFRSPPPPALDSAAYTQAYNEVKDFGSINSAVRTADETNIAKFWADNAGTETPPGHWNSIAQVVSSTEHLSLADDARMFALLNISQADAAIVAWDDKYTYNFWRPITAIQQAATAGNPNISADPTWQPLLTTPNFPSYVSGHSTFSGAASTILASFIGTDNFSFTSTTDTPGIAARSFTSFSQAADEAGQSRIYAGIHFQFDNQAGLSAGRDLGAFVFANELQPVPEPSTIALAAVAGLILLACRLRQRQAKRTAWT